MTLILHRFKSLHPTRGASDLAARVVHAGSIGAVLTPGSEVVRQQLEARRRVSLITFDPNVRPSLLPDYAETRRALEGFISAAHVVKASEEDLAWLYPGTDPRAVVDQWVEDGAAFACVTLGGAGAYVATPQASFQQAGRRAEVVDTVGAGDSFMAALIHKLLERDPAEIVVGLDRGAASEVARFANAAAAVTVSRRGADLPTLDDVARVA